VFLRLGTVFAEPRDYLAQVYSSFRAIVGEELFMLIVIQAMHGFARFFGNHYNSSSSIKRLVFENER